ncbi:hypothetical protein J2W24_003145 [Variovorax boronicumulans]|uniref:hypothetical protein n=1 Tax=Variovorax boronicumulans TaxID=436515 RepID=UPI002785A5F6|nr:hypothetical protein [Variovorax boronicumulans]MDP9917494.1 hypothetical protein [Variovorax boronicumulans]
MVSGMNVMCVICRVDAVNGRMEIVPVQDVEKHYDYLTNGEVFDRRADWYIADGLGFKNANGGLHSHVPLMFGTALPLGPNGSVSAYQRTIVTARFLDGRPYYQQTVTTGDWRPRPRCATTWADRPTHDRRQPRPSSVPGPRPCI